MTGRGIRLQHPLPWGRGRDVSRSTSPGLVACRSGAHLPRPLELANLAVDLLPVVAALAFGWGAASLVALYGFENLTIGVFTFLRMIAIGVQDTLKLAGAVFLALFLAMQNGGFCFGYGIFLFTIAGNPSFPGPAELVGWAAGSGAHMGWFLAAIVEVNLAPYGRIVTLHLANILGAALTLGMEEPLAGVLFLILLWAAFGVVISVARGLKREALFVVDANSAALKGAEWQTRARAAPIADDPL